MPTRISFLVALFLMAANATAMPITWDIKVGITRISPELTGYANLGDVVTLRFTFESSTPDAEPAIAERGKFDEAVIETGITLNSMHASVGSGGYITIVNDFFGRDEYLTSSTDSTAIATPLPAHNGFVFSGYNE